MRKYIEEVKTRSYAQKQQFAFLASAGITAVIAGIWLLAIIASPDDYIDVNTDEIQNLANTGSLFDAFKGL